MIVSDRTSVMDTSSLHVPVTVMVLGPFWGSAASAALMLWPGQSTVTSVACAPAGSRKKVSKTANTDALNTRFIFMAMLLSIFDLAAESPYLVGDMNSVTRDSASPRSGPKINLWGDWCAVPSKTISCEDILLIDSYSIFQKSYC